MNLTRRAVRIATLTVLGVVSACAGSPRVEQMIVSGAWARPTPDGATVAAVYMRVESPVDDELIAVATPVATSGMVHEVETGRSDGHQGHSHGGGGGGSGAVTMVESRLSVGAGSIIELVPGGTHLMLEGLSDPLVEGETFELTLTFREAGAVRVPVAVRLNGL